MTKTQQHLNLLGFQIEDKVTGFKGVVESICFEVGVQADGDQGPAEKPAR